MKIEIEKAEVFEIDSSKPHFVLFETEQELTKETVRSIRESLVKSFNKLGVDNVVVTVAMKGKLTISEVEGVDNA